jgi:hypothetical protein
MGILLFASFDSILAVEPCRYPSGAHFPLIARKKAGAKTAVPFGMEDACETAPIGGRARCRRPRRHRGSTSKTSNDVITLCVISL